MTAYVVAAGIPEQGSTLLGRFLCDTELVDVCLGHGVVPRVSHAVLYQNQFFGAV